MAWDRSRLVDVARHRLKGAKLIVVANREPYIHMFAPEGIRCMRPASGLTTALDPVMRACGGAWIAHGSGAADRAVSDALGRIRVPPEDPSYMLRRVWLSKEEEEGYYYGFANEALWPLCHAAYTRPRFDARDFEQYRLVNQKFADAVLDEAADQPAIVFIQDYHFALLPRMLRVARPDLVIMQFWHIPWPNRESFRICPWQEQILDGLLGNDLLSFHIQHHCNNFLDTVERGIESRVDLEHFAVLRGGATTMVRPQPISIDMEEAFPSTTVERSKDEKHFRDKFGLAGKRLLVGVDRVDYIKGIPERFHAIDRLLELHPVLRGQIVFFQVGAPSRTRILTYQCLADELDILATEINRKHGTDEWKPILFVNEHFGPDQLFALYRMAEVCVVSSLHDGMNLVAKEFVAARTDLRGVLVLSRFTGAARELTEAMQINPYAVDEFADALHGALSMSSEEQEHRMMRMRARVADNNIFRWAGMLLSEAGKLGESRYDRTAEKTCCKNDLCLSKRLPVGAPV